jgi:hypothetical protein
VYPVEKRPGELRKMKNNNSLHTALKK